MQYSRQEHHFKTFLGVAKTLSYPIEATLSLEWICPALMKKVFPVSLEALSFISLTRSRCVFRCSADRSGQTKTVLNFSVFRRLLAFATNWSTTIELETLTFTGRVAVSSLLDLLPILHASTIFGFWPMLWNTSPTVSISSVSFSSARPKTITLRLRSSFCTTCFNYCLQRLRADDLLLRLIFLHNRTVSLEFWLDRVNDRRFNGVLNVPSNSVLQQESSSWTLITCFWLSMRLFCATLVSSRNPLTHFIIFARYSNESRSNKAMSGLFSLLMSLNSIFSSFVPRDWFSFPTTASILQESARSYWISISS